MNSYKVPYSDKGAVDTAVCVVFVDLLACSWQVRTPCVRAMAARTPCARAVVFFRYNCMRRVQWP